LTVCFQTKLEGVVYAGICSCALLPLCLQRGWLKNKLVWRSIAVVGASLVPYVFYRLTKPIAHPESHWMGYLASKPAVALPHFPQVLFLNIFARFFSAPFFQWTPQGDHMQWTGHWTGLGCLVNPEISVLPWLLLVLLILSVIFKPGGRKTIIILSAVTLAVFTFLSFVEACLPDWDTSQMINMGCNISGRHFYPFFVAWFLGVATLWFVDEKPSPESPSIQPRTIEPLAPKSKRRR
jgi:hypothetical protein